MVALPSNFSAPDWRSRKIAPQQGGFLRELTDIQYWVLKETLQAQKVRNFEHGIRNDMLEWHQLDSGGNGSCVAEGREVQAEKKESAVGERTCGIERGDGS